MRFSTMVRHGFLFINARRRLNSRLPGGIIGGMGREDLFEFPMNKRRISKNIALFFPNVLTIRK